MLSRRTDLIISGGENISPFEIEEKLNALENITESCVFPVDDKEWGQIAAAAIVVKKNFQGIENSIREELKQTLPSFKIPKRIFIIKEIPKTSIGKPRREEIKKLFTGADAL
ncbi:MAG TPA: class I adenylate-forming enzyme family protein [Ignavibacteriales bacterium]|nr:class I adenylate-forming enzyme family protein [Ignavibacteriales bacterium]